MKHPLLAVFYIVVVAELTLSFLSIVLGLLIYGAGLLFIAIDFVVGKSRLSKTGFAALSLIMVTRLAAYSMPYQGISSDYWLLMASAPTLLGLVVLRLVGGVSFREMGFTGQEFFLTMLISSVGVAYSFFAYVAAPQVVPTVVGETIYGTVLAYGSLFVVACVVEEIIYRGLLNQVTVSEFGLGKGLLLNSSLYALMFTGTRSGEYILIMWMFALLLGWAVCELDSIWVSIFARTSFVALWIFVWPIML